MTDGPYVFQNNRRLRCGFTTGTCATAAAKAATIHILSGSPVDAVEVRVPRGDMLKISVKCEEMLDVYAKYSVIKDGGDDIDATHGKRICSEVVLTGNEIVIEGGKGVGRVTKSGLDQPVGNVAINSVPRKMITDAVMDVLEKYDYKGGAVVTVSVPEGEEIAKHTFNPNLGIIGGISIIGTSGIVMPMSETALISTIKVDMDVRKAEGRKVILVVPGNYGEEYADTILGLSGKDAVKCSNFIGDMLDHACEIGVDILLVGNIGKLVKVAGGIMNTHSRNADSRMEILSAYCVLSGGSSELVCRIMGCASTDAALSLMMDENIVDKVCSMLMDRIAFHMNHRTQGKIRTAAVMFSSKYGLLGKTKNADMMIEEMIR